MDLLPEAFIGGVMALELTVISIEDMSSGPTKNVFEQDEISIGRASINDLVLNKPEVSGRHTKIRIEYDESESPHIYVTDLGSLNGTTVEGKLLEPQIEHEMEEGQRIGIGSFIIRPKIYNLRGTISDLYDNSSLWHEDGNSTLMAQEEESLSPTKNEPPFLAKNDFEGEDEANDTEEISREYRQEKSPFLTMEDFEKTTEAKEESREFSEKESAAELFEESMNESDTDEDQEEVDSSDEVEDIDEEDGVEDSDVEEVTSEEDDESEIEEDEGTESDEEDEEEDEEVEEVDEEVEENEEVDEDEEAMMEEDNVEKAEDSIVLEETVDDGDNIFNFDAIRLCSISGNVSHKNKGLDGVELVLTLDDGDVKNAHTSKNGQFTFDDIDEGTKYSLEAKKEGYKIVADNTEGILSDDLLIQFESCKFYKISGRVVNKGNGLAGVVVKSDALGSTTTDEDGNFEFIDVEEDTEYNLEFEKESYQFEAKNNSGTLTKDQDVEVKATKLIPVEGVIYYKGKPLGGVEIDGGPIGKTITGEDGRYCFPDVPEGTQYTLIPHKEGYKFGKH